MLFDQTPIKIKKLRKMAKERDNIPWNMGKIYGQETITCTNCGKKKTTYKSRKAKFCSHKCSTVFYSGDNHHMRKKYDQ